MGHKVFVTSDQLRSTTTTTTTTTTSPKKKGLMSKKKKTAVHVRYKSLYIFLPSSAKQEREPGSAWSGNTNDDD